MRDSVQFENHYELLTQLRCDFRESDLKMLEFIGRGYSEVKTTDSSCYYYYHAWLGSLEYLPPKTSCLRRFWSILC